MSEKENNERLDADLTEESSSEAEAVETEAPDAPEADTADAKLKGGDK